MQLTDRVTDGWLATDPRASAHRDAALQVLEGPEEVAFATVLDGAGDVLARGRVALTERADVWAGISDLWVRESRRRERLGHEVLAALLGWAAERGATTAFLQVTDDNRAALALYERLRFVTHHTYRYLQPPRRQP